MLIPGAFPKIFRETTVTNVSFATPFSTRRINKRSCNNQNSNSLIFWNVVFDILIFYVIFFRKPLLLNFCTGNITDQLDVKENRKINLTKQCQTLFVIFLKEQVQALLITNIIFLVIFAITHANGVCIDFYVLRERLSNIYQITW